MRNSPSSTIRVRAPATTANMGAGFDICGMALHGIHDEFRISLSRRWSVRNHGQYNAATHPVRSVFGAVWRAMKRRYKLKGSLKIDTYKDIKPRAGMGSSASEGAATAFAVNRLCGLGLSAEELIYWAGKGEAFAAKVAHYDNVGPAVLGGVTIMRGSNPQDIVRLNPPDIHCMLVINNREKASTAAARAAIPDTIPTRAAFRNQSTLARLIFALHDAHEGRDGHARKVIDALDDEIVEPARSKAGILPLLLELRTLAKKHGFNAVASGAGPTLIVMAEPPVGDEKQQAFEQAVCRLYSRKGIQTDLRWVRPSHQGVHEIKA